MANTFRAAILGASTLTTGNALRDHLHNLKVIFLNGFEVEVDLAPIVATVDMTGISVILSPQDVDVIVESSIQVTLDDQQITTEIETNIDVTLGCE